MHAEDELFERLRAAIVEIAGDDATQLLVEARADARERVRALLSDALASSMLQRAGEQLELPELGWYVYGVISSEDAIPGPTFAGIEPSHPVMVLREGSLAAVASRISLLEFGETPLRAHLADAEWVERTSRAHERALEQIHSQAAVIPIRMCTVYRTEGGVRERLRREAHSLEHALSHLRGKDEFGVKVFADLHRGIGAGGADPPLSEQSGSGRMPYLIEEACARVHEQLCAVATDGLVAPSVPFAAEAHAGELILNGVYLVEDRSREAFDNEVRELGRELGRLGIELQATGPWAAYNFVPGAIGAAW